MLVEEFKICVTECTVICLNERKVATLQQAATLAEEFALMHKSVFSKSDPPFHRGFRSGLMTLLSLSPEQPCQVLWRRDSASSVTNLVTSLQIAFP